MDRQRTAKWLLVISVLVAGAVLQGVASEKNDAPMRWRKAPAVMADDEDDAWITALPWEGATPTMAPDLETVVWEDD